MDKVEKILKKIQTIASNITDKDLNEKLKKYEDNFDSSYIKIVFPKKIEISSTRKYTLNQLNNYKVVDNNGKCDFEEDETWKMSKAV